MFAIIQNNLIALLVPTGTAFEWDGISYPQNWCNLSNPEEKAAIGMVDVIYGVPANDQYYWVGQDEPVYKDGVVVINYTAKAKDLAPSLTSALAALSTTAWTILSPSDWMVTKAVETSTLIPPAWNTWRAQIRLQAQNQREAINACTTIAQLAALPPVVWELDPDLALTVPSTPVIVSLNPNVGGFVPIINVANNGGSPITAVYYEIYKSQDPRVQTQGNRTVSGAGPSYTFNLPVNSLTLQGVPLDIVVRAVNSVGQSSSSQPVTGQTK